MSSVPTSHVEDVLARATSAHQEGDLESASALYLKKFSKPSRRTPTPCIAPGFCFWNKAITKRPIVFLNKPDGAPARSGVLQSFRRRVA